VGALDYNLKLSADRADAVVKALIGRGSAASRLKGAGVGPYCPVASNRAEAGRAKNRRVELVEQK
jgi:OOP family OmpA-OmpF porin